MFILSVYVGGGGGGGAGLRPEHQDAYSQGMHLPSALYSYHFFSFNILVIVATVICLSGTVIKWNLKSSHKHRIKLCI
jgi:hypothetical protein